MFVQMVSENSRMGYSAALGMYYLKDLFKFTERVWREAKSWGNAYSKHVFNSEISVGDFEKISDIFLSRSTK